MDEHGKLIDTVALFRARNIEVGLYVSGTHDGKHTHAVIYAVAVPNEENIRRE